MQLEQVHHIDEANLQVREILAQHGRCGQGFLGGDIPGGRHHHIRLRPLIVAGPVPDTEALGAVSDGGVHVQILQVLLLVRDDHVDVILAAQAVIGDR